MESVDRLKKQRPLFRRPQKLLSHMVNETAEPIDLI